MTIKKGDKVVIIAGKDKGKQGTVETVIALGDRVTVGGINIHKRHFKPSRTRAKGGIVEFAAPLHRSNVMIQCPHCSKMTRVKHVLGEDGTKHRHCIHCQASLDSN